MSALRVSSIWVAAAVAALAQTPVAPTGERVGEARGDNAGDYNILQSWELGYRFHTVTGNEGKYRSDVNYGNGVRLLSSRLSINSRDGHGAFFDELIISTQGLGNDPYEFASLRVAKNRLYRYDFLWRSNDYFNPALAVAGGEHGIDTSRRMQDHEFTLFPQSKIRIFAGFSRNIQEGPAMTTVNQFDIRGDEFLLFANVHRTQNEYRIGNEFRLAGIRFNWLQAWEVYREDTPVSLPGPSAGNNPTDRTTLDSLIRTEPYKGTTPSIRVSLFREQGEHWAVNGRFTYSAGRRDFTFDESAIGIDRFGAARNRQILAAGNARRPVASAYLTLSVFPASKWTITNHTAFHNTRMEGDFQYRELNNSTLVLDSINFQHLGICNITNVTDALYQLRPWISFHGGYQYANRQIDSVEQVTIGGVAGAAINSQHNELNAGIFGFRLHPLKPLTFAADGELGRQPRPFYPVSDKDYHALSARAQWRQGPLTLSAMARSFYNFNTASMFSSTARTRQYSYDGSWNPRDWFSLEGGYSKIHADTATGIAYFLGPAFVQGEQSLYVSNLHSVYLGLHLALREHVTLYVGVNATRDTGDGNLTGGPALPAFRAVQTFPMDFDSPLARVSVKLHPKVRWNVGYQYYRYREDLLPPQNYHANTGYTSVLWTF